jgi:hypothetical protein
MHDRSNSGAPAPGVAGYRSAADGRTPRRPLAQRSRRVAAIRRQPDGRSAGGRAGGDRSCTPWRCHGNSTHRRRLPPAPVSKPRCAAWANSKRYYAQSAQHEAQLAYARDDPVSSGTAATGVGRNSSHRVASMRPRSRRPHLTGDPAIRGLSGANASKRCGTLASFGDQKSPPAVRRASITTAAGARSTGPSIPRGRHESRSRSTTCLGDPVGDRAKRRIGATTSKLGAASSRPGR